MGNEASMNSASRRVAPLTIVQNSFVSAVSELNARVAFPSVTSKPTVGTM